MGRTPIRAKRVLDAYAELKARIMHYLHDLNSDPVAFRRLYRLEEQIPIPAGTPKEGFDGEGDKS
jgi:hypothetical protein